MVVAVRLEDRGAFRAAAAALASMDKNLSRDLRLVLRREVQPVMAQQRALARSLPAMGVSGSTGLRRTVARGVRLKLALGNKPQMRIVTTMSERSLGFAPRGLDTLFSGWTAPLFGDRSRWYPHDMSGPSWFVGPAGDAQPEMQAAVVKTLNMTAGEIASKAGSLRGS